MKKATSSEVHTIMKAIEYRNIISSMEYNGRTEAPAARGPARIAAELYSI